MKTADFDFPLAEELISVRPLKERGTSRLLVLHRNGPVEHRRFTDLPSYLNKGDMLVLNNTRVFPARLTGRKKKNGGRIDMLLVNKKSDAEWEILSKGGYSGGVLIAPGFEADLRDGQHARFHGSGNITDLIREHGEMPIPPYMRRLPDSSDKEDYQTVFSRVEGSIAAPTAGLHFTRSVLERISSRGVKLVEVTLHVGIGTFKPVRADSVAEHRMDSENFVLDSNLPSEIAKTKSAGGRVVCVGTTTTRTLEGVLSGKCTISSENGKLSGSTDIFIFPGHIFRAADVLVTNFHLPKSTPLMLTSAFTGLEKLLAAYKEAMARGYRFLSYGDAMLIL